MTKVIGCDGAFSSTRRLLLGAEYDAKYAHQTVYRAFIPIPAAIAALGREQSRHSNRPHGP